ncbi:unnamed protein product [Protopolystoma xenopodis]|uniref:Uncharacterized protein n=1 Tax=Protopolystoma xenopodis TaxID=117903 RepID=A0A448WAZ8_9PLAT|nr:unnamed protein product [Protopolystoma xenopodis]
MSQDASPTPTFASTEDLPVQPSGLTPQTSAGCRNFEIKSDSVRENVEAVAVSTAEVEAASRASKTDTPALSSANRRDTKGGRKMCPVEESDAVLERQRMFLKAKMNLCIEDISELPTVGQGVVDAGDRFSTIFPSLL